MAKRHPFSYTFYIHGKSWENSLKGVHSFFDFIKKIFALAEIGTFWRRKFSPLPPSTSIHPLYVQDLKRKLIIKNL
jgi:hypothetical protein